MNTNERTSTRVARIAGKVLALDPLDGRILPKNVPISMGSGHWPTGLTLADLQSLAASALTQTADRADVRSNRTTDDSGFDPREGGELEGRWRPKSAQVRKMLRGDLGTHFERVTPPAIEGKQPSSWPPSAKPPRGSP